MTKVSKSKSKAKKATGSVVLYGRASRPDLARAMKRATKALGRKPTVGAMVSIAVSLYAGGAS